VKRIWLAVLAGTLSCSDALAPPLEGDLYSLQSIAGVPLPARYALIGPEGEHIVADTLALRANGTGTRRTRYEYPKLKPQSTEVSFKYTRVGDHIEIKFPCPDLCTEGPDLSGTITGSGIAIDESPYTLTPFIYVRSFPPD
jgi:hypothetical protein